ncbi:MAG: hypothetical protein H7842_14335, partial [Gammaproteobacteria bacterium SHHR-1]
MNRRDFLQHLGALAALSSLSQTLPAASALAGAARASVNGRLYTAAFPAPDRASRTADKPTALVIGLGPVGGMVIDICLESALPLLDGWHLVAAPESTNPLDGGSVIDRLPLGQHPLTHLRAVPYQALESLEPNPTDPIQPVIVYLVIAEHDELSYRLAETLASHYRSKDSFVIGVVLRPIQGLTVDQADRLGQALDALIDLPRQSQAPEEQHPVGAFADLDCLRAANVVTAVHATYAANGLIAIDSTDITSLMRKTPYLRAAPFYMPPPIEMTSAYLDRQVNQCLKELENDADFPSSLVLTLDGGMDLTLGQFDQVGECLCQLADAHGWRQEPLIMLGTVVHDDPQVNPLY